MKLCDLHTHSTFSDGTFTPKEIIDLSIEKGLSAVALTDHNTIDGIPEFIAASKGKNIEAVLGGEFSVDYNGTELHLLGLFIPRNALKQVNDMMAEAQRRKEKSNIELIESLNRAGYEIEFFQLKAASVNGRFNRAHIAEALTRRGYTKSKEEAFATLLAKDGPHYKEPKRITLFEMISFLKEIGAVPVLAHPFLNLDEAAIDELLPKAKECGLVGIECFYSEYDEETTKKSVALADKYGLKYSGGSDFHGAIKPHINLGTGKGNLEIPYELATNMK